MAVSLTVLCDLEALRTRVAIELSTHGVHVGTHTGFALLLDRPWGWALQRLPGLDLAQTLIYSDNPCPEYQLDLLDHKPLALLHDLDLKEIAAWAAHRDAVAFPRKTWMSPLTSAERSVLQRCARGQTDDEIARQLDTTETQVRDSLDGLCRKLGLTGRVQASLYYLGSWHMLEPWRPPHAQATS